MFFRNYAIASVSLLLLAQVDVDHFDVGISSIYGDVEVHEARRSLPPDAGLDVRTREVSLVEEVGCGDSDKVGGPQFEAGSSLVVSKTTKVQCRRWE